MDLVGPEALERAVELFHAGLATDDAGELGGDECLLEMPAFGKQRAEIVFGVAVGGRGVDERGAAGEEDVEHLLERFVFRAAARYLEAAGRPHADGWHQLAARWNLALEDVA